MRAAMKESKGRRRHGVSRLSIVGGLLVFLIVATAGCDSSSIPTAQPTSPTTTPAPMPTVDPSLLERPPQGPGAEIGNVYPYTLYVHCGVRDAHFDGRVWMADPMLGNYNPPPGWTSDDSRGTIELVRDDLAIFKSVSGRTIEFIPWPSDIERTPCY